MISVEQRFGYSRNLRARRRSISADARLPARRARSSLTRIIAALSGSALEPEHFGCWRCRMISDGRRPERFQAKACPGLDPGWKPVRVKKTRQIRNLEPRFDSIETEKGLAKKQSWRTTDGPPRSTAVPDAWLSRRDRIFPKRGSRRRAGRHGRPAPGGRGSGISAPSPARPETIPVRRKDRRRAVHARRY